MRIDLLKESEQIFLKRYPGGFYNIELEEIKKKHKPDKMHQMAVDFFSKEAFKDVDETIENIIRIVTRSSLVSVFEKTKFRDYGRNLDPQKKKKLVNSVKELLHGNQENGFEDLVALLKEDKLAKWPIVSVISYYYKPQTEVFLKPTTVKGIIKTYELEDIKYSPTPSYDFYIKYRAYLLEMRSLVSTDLGTDNASFSGFLMMMLNDK